MGLIMKILFLYIWMPIVLSTKQSHKKKIENTATIIFVGDISFDGPVRYFADTKSCDYKSPFKHVKKFLAEADLRVANLESPLLSLSNSSFTPDLERKTTHLVGSVQAVEGLTYAEFDIIQLANNHFSDFGVQGMKSTIQALKKADIEIIGVTNGGRRGKAQKPVIKNINGLKIGFLAYCEQREGCERFYALGPVVFDRKIAKKDIAAIKQTTDIVVVMLHWSTEYMPVPPKGVRDLANSLNQLGADVIIGQHPHVVQGHECIKDSIVVYSLGNFLFPWNGIDKESLYGAGTPSKAQIQRYLQETSDEFNPTKLSYMFRVTVSKNGIVAADYLQLLIKNEPETNCLQPTPITGKWQKFCGDKDYYCYDFPTICAVSVEMLDEERFRFGKKNKQCIKGKQ